MELARYWIEFDSLNEDGSKSFLKNCGVTAWSYDDATTLIRTILYANQPMPLIKEVVKNIELSMLDENHILHNIGPTNFRGIWWPNGYFHLTK